MSMDEDDDNGHQQSIGDLEGIIWRLSLQPCCVNQPWVTEQRQSQDESQGPWDSKACTRNHLKQINILFNFWALLFNLFK